MYNSEFTVETIAREGAILVLPDGASREDLVSTSNLTKYIEKHALDWHNFMFKQAPTSASMIPNGSLYLVTGCDKSRSWSTVAIPSGLGYAGDKIQMTFKKDWWMSNDLARTNTLRKGEEGDKNFAVILRGIRISLSNRVWSTHLHYEPPDGAAYYQSLSTPILGLRSRLFRWKEMRFGKSKLYLEDREQV